MANSRSGLIVIICALLVVAGVITSVIVDSNTTTTVTSILTSCTAVIGATALWFEYKRNIRINKSNFLINLNTSFYVGGSGVTSLMAQLETILDNDKYGIKKYTLTEKDCELIVKYLTWLKVLCEVICKKVIKLNDVDDLFGAKFFSVVNNPEIQKLVLSPHRHAYRKIYIVHRAWAAYRKKRNISIYRMETDLSNVENYDQFSV